MISIRTRVVSGLNRFSGINRRMINIMFTMVIKFTSYPTSTPPNTNSLGIPTYTQVNTSQEMIKTPKERSIFQWTRKPAGSSHPLSHPNFNLTNRISIFFDYLSEKEGYLTVGDIVWINDSEKEVFHKFPF